MKKLIVLCVLCSCGSYRYNPTDGLDINKTDYQPIDILIIPASIPNRVVYPKHLTWANIDLNGDGVGENYITSVKSQPCGDCYMYASLALVEARWQIDNRIQVSLNLSEQNIHNCMKIPCDGAGEVDWMLDYIKDYGVMLDENMPTGVWMPRCENCIGWTFGGLGPVEIKNVPFYKIKAYNTLEKPKAYIERKQILVSALQNGPVAVGVNGWLGYGNDNGMLYCKEEKPSGHSILVVGYLDYGSVFLVKNSHNEGKLIQMIFEGGDKCGFASVMNTLSTGSVYVEWGSGEKYCRSMVDSDRDGIPDAHDNCPWDANPKQEDFDGDGWGDACDRCPKEKDAFGFYCPPDKPTTTSKQELLNKKKDMGNDQRAR